MIVDPTTLMLPGGYRLLFSLCFRVFSTAAAVEETAAKDDSDVFVGVLIVYFLARTVCDTIDNCAP